MNRAARRRIGRLQDRASKSPLHFDQFLEEANRQSDPTKPLNWEAQRARHKPEYCVNPLGGRATRPSNFGAGCPCESCGHTVPWEETERE